MDTNPGERLTIIIFLLGVFSLFIVTNMVGTPEKFITREQTITVSSPPEHRQRTVYRSRSSSTEYFVEINGTGTQGQYFISNGYYKYLDHSRFNRDIKPGSSIKISYEVNQITELYKDGIGYINTQAYHKYLKQGKASEYAVLLGFVFSLLLFSTRYVVQPKTYDWLLKYALMITIATITMAYFVIKWLLTW